jgi:hypothetical protein
MDEGKHCRVHFRVRSSTRIGEVIGIGGSGFALGNFNQSKFVQLVTNPETYPQRRTQQPQVNPKN